MSDARAEPERHNGAMRWRRKKEPTGGTGAADAVVDALAIAPDGATVELYLIPPPDWSDQDEELLALNQRIHDAVGFALDGQMQRDYPETVGYRWRIVVDWQEVNPAESTSEWLREVANQVTQQGGELVEKEA